MSRLALALILGSPLAVPTTDDPLPFPPTDSYLSRSIEGWTVRVNRTFPAQHPALCAEVLDLLGRQLAEIARVVPAPALARLRAIPVWVEYDEPNHPCMCYHVDRGWLRDHAMNPDKAKGIEIADARNFLDWTRDQPWMVLHELAHGYHDRELGFDHPPIVAAHEAARESGTYDKVLRISGRDDRHYALTNPTEYFAELTECYFGTNDFYPFVRAELRRHDPAGLEAIERAWGVNSTGSGLPGSENAAAPAKPIAESRP